MTNNKKVGLAVVVAAVLAGGAATFHFARKSPDPVTCVSHSEKSTDLLACATLPEPIKSALSIQNSDETKDGCEYTNRTSNHVVGKQFVSWMLDETYMCENAAHPGVGSTSKTYFTNDGAEVDFVSEFDLKALSSFLGTRSVGVESRNEITSEPCEILLPATFGDSTDGDVATEDELPHSKTDLGLRIIESDGDLVLVSLVRDGSHANRSCVRRVELALRLWRQFLSPNSRIGKML